jgi:hypothetical protein
MTDAREEIEQLLNFLPLRAERAAGCCRQSAA